MKNIEFEAVTLKDGTDSTLFYIPHANIDGIPADLVEQMMETFNAVVDEGTSYPYSETCKVIDEFKAIWLTHECAILVKGKQTKLKPGLKLQGTYYVRPNYPGRCSHNCNAGFIVPYDSRGLRVGEALAKSYKTWAPNLGYTYSVFNLVFESNVKSWKLWERMGFERIGRIPGAARLKGIDEPVDALIYGLKFAK